MLVVNDIMNAILPNKPIGQVDAWDFKRELHTILERIFALKGIDYSANLASMIEDELEHVVSHSYPILTIPEVKIALESGVTGEFTKVGNTITVANCIGWIRMYFNCDERRAARQNIEGMRRYTPEDEKSVEEIAALNRDTEIHEPDNAYQRYLAEGRTIITIGYAAMLYDALVKAGKMNPSEATRHQAEVRALAEMKRGESRFAAIGSAGDVAKAYTKRELLYQYFEALKNRNVSQIKIS